MNDDRSDTVSYCMSHLIEAIRLTAKLADAANRDVTIEHMKLWSD